MRVTASLVLAGVLALSGCGDIGAIDTRDPSGDWQLVTGTVDGAEVPEADAITLEFAEGRVGGRAACNSYFGEVQVGGTVWSGGGYGQTEMGCEGPLMDAERIYLTALARISSFEVTDDALTLVGDGVRLDFTRQAEIPAADVVGTRWLLDTVFTGVGGAGAASSVSGDDAVLVFSDDGTFTAATGCRELRGTYAFVGAEIQVRDLSADGDCPPDLQRQDSEVIATLEGAMTVAVVEDRLTLTAIGGSPGLGFRAQR